jgi:serine phosphatase RsbU (regulator of sigma subunit)
MSTFLESLDPELQNIVEQFGTEVVYGSGQTVFRRGDPGSAMYVIAKGSVRIHDGELTLNSLAEGEVFGEIAGLGGMDRTATVTAEEDLVLVRVERDMLLSAIQESPGALRELVRMLCERESGMANRMTDRTWRLRAAEHELEIGRRIQSGFLPATLPDVDGYEIAGHFQAARVVAGDFYDAFLIPSLGRVALVIGDVCDKGVGAALFMTLFRSLIRATAQSRRFMNWAVDHNPANTRVSEGQDIETLADETLKNTISLTNNYVAATHGSTSMFASVFIALLDPQTGELSYINAGHEEAFIIDASGIKTRLPASGPVVGIFAGAGHEIGRATLDRGSTLFTYSDGVPEATARHGEQFTDVRLQGLLAGYRGTAAEFVEMIISSISEFTEGAQQHDDITMLACRRDTG